MEAALEEMEKLKAELMKTLWLLRMKLLTERLNSAAGKVLVQRAIANCTNETVVRWLRGRPDSDLSCLAEMFHFLKPLIEEAEKKNHGADVDITLVAHGAIRDSSLAACCLLPLPAVADVLLYSPWNCIMNVDVVYGVATGLMKPRHRVFHRRTKGDKLGEAFRPGKLPDCWNSMRKAGDQMIPNITLSPLEAGEDGVWAGFQALAAKHGQPGRNRIVIPLTGCSGSVPLHVVTLALALALMTSRFRATVHLTACLGDQSSGLKFDKDVLQTQYAVTADDTIMTSSPDMFAADETLGFLQRLRRYFHS